MKKIGLEYTKTSLKNLKKLEKKTSLRIISKVKENSEMKSPLERAKPLTGLFENTYRYRIGNYRVVFKYDESGIINILTVLTVKHRKDIYK